MKKKTFFQHLNKHLGQTPGKTRFLKELHDHWEDKMNERTLSKQDMQTEELGNPEDLAKFYRKNRQDNRLRNITALAIFLCVFSTVEIFSYNFDTGISLGMDFLVNTGVTLFIFAVPVLLFSFLSNYIGYLFFGFELMGGVSATPLYQLFLLPFLTALHYTVLFLILFNKYRERKQRRLFTET